MTYLLHEKNTRLGIAISTLAYFFVALVSVFQKSVHSSTPLMVTLFFQNAVSLLCTLPWVMKSGLRIQESKLYFTYFIRITSGVACYAALFYIIRYMPISEGLLFQYTASLWIPLISLIWLGVRMQNKLWIPILMGFIGIIYLLEPREMLAQHVLFIAIFCGILQAISIVSVRRLLATEAISRILFYYFLTGAMFTFPFVAHNITTLSVRDFSLLLAVGLSTFLAQYFIAVSLQYAHASTLAPICYFSIVFSSIFDFVIWHDHFHQSVIIGMVLVLLSGTLLIFLSKKPLPSAHI